MTGWIQTYSGRRFFPLLPDPADVVLEDVAHALSQVCRFQGHCARFYSVAEHSVHVATVLWRGADGWPIEKRRRLALAGLLHDSGEAYLADVARPVKGSLRVGLQRFDFVECQIRSVVWSVLAGLSDWDPSWLVDLSRADDALLQRERLELFRNPEAWPGLDVEPADVSIECWDPEQAEAAFLAEFASLAGDGRAAHVEE